MKPEVTSMPLGYLQGKQYHFDKRYDEFAELDIWKRLHREAGKRGFGSKISFSHITRGYLCEVVNMTRMEKSANWYFINVGHKYGADPLEATILAYRECVPHDPLMAVLYLEAEVTLLGLAAKAASKRAADRTKVLRKLEVALDALSDALRLVVPVDWPFECQNCIGMPEYGCYCEKVGAVAPGGPLKAPIHDEDDDL